MPTSIRLKAFHCSTSERPWSAASIIRERC
jgi:hypothetical protein